MRLCKTDENFSEIMECSSTWGSPQQRLPLHWLQKIAPARCGIVVLPFEIPVNNLQDAGEPSSALQQNER